MKTLILSLFFVFTTVLAAQPQGKPDSVKTYTLEPTIITATKTVTQQKNVTASVSVVSSNEISSMATSQLLSAVSERVPGMYVQRQGVIGYGINTQAGGISIRGLGGNPNTQVLVMIDGTPQFMGLFGHPFPDMYTTESASKVEVIRGPASVLYGGNAMGGVINIITKTPENKGLSAHLSASYGSFNTDQLNAEIGTSSNIGSLSISAGHQQTDGHRTNSEFNQNDIFAKGTTDLAEDLSLSATAEIVKFKSYDPGPASTPLVDNWYDVLRGRAGISLNEKKFGGDGALNLFYSWGRHTIFDGFHSTDNMVTAQLYHNITLTPNDILTAGIDVERYGGTAENTKASVQFGSYSVHEEAGYLFAQHFFTHGFIVNGGIRLNHHNLYGNEIVPQIGTSLQVADNTTLKASASKGFRSPTIRELYLFPAPTPTLQPESMWNYEFGVLQTLPYKANVEVVAFLNEGTNLIKVGGMFPNLTLSNTGRFVHRGIECSLHYFGVEWIDLHSSYSYLSAGNDTRANPRHKLFVGISHTHGIVTIDVNNEYIAKLYGSDFSRQLLPSYDLLNAIVSVRLLEGMTCRVSAENILNTSYQMVYDYPMPGRTLSLAVSWMY